MLRKFKVTEYHRKYARSIVKYLPHDMDDAFIILCIFMQFFKDAGYEFWGEELIDGK